MSSSKPLVFKNLRGTWCVARDCCSRGNRLVSTFGEALSLANFHAMTHVPFKKPIAIYIQNKSEWVWCFEKCYNLDEVLKVGHKFGINLEKLFIESPTLIRPGTTELLLDVDSMPEKYFV